ncbi:MAG: SulP family inorganic anion transporter [Noviherbaspirillum sp.]
MPSLRLRFHPRLLDEVRTYDSTRFGRDLSAGVTVAAVALPLAMAFAIASGATPQAGITTAIVAGLIISLLGGARVQIGGPAGAFIVIIYGIIEKYGFGNLLAATMFAGLMLLAMGALKLGSVIRYMPVAIVVGFTNGIGVLIALSQLKDFFGLDIARMPGDFVGQVRMLAMHAHSVDPPILALGAACLALVFLWPRLFTTRHAETLQRNALFRLLRALPGTIIVLVAATGAVLLLGLDVATIGSRFGGIPQALPALAVPAFSLELVRELFAPALTIAMLGAIESLLCAKVADNLTGDRHDPNQELMAQGIANMVVPFFSGLPATGTIARTVINIRSGASSPVAGIVHAAALLFIMLAAAPLARHVPLAALAAILLYVAYNMFEWHALSRMMRLTMPYRILLLVTFFLTVVIDLTVAVEVGLVLACVFFIYWISGLTTIEPVRPQLLPSSLPAGVEAYAIFGSLFFGAVGKLEALLAPDTPPPRVLILEMHKLINLDVTCLEVLEQIHATLHRHGSRLILCGPNHQPRTMMERSGFLERLGCENCVRDLHAAFALVKDEALAA